ncbi:hypothetical protein KQX54_015617 [Cotesia glomerata]|uniref:dUTPase-like domain-containing protein n=1 Tax=Cotesia glomerata TaxID=32391 RepID=A0AAV7ISS9_COTGL|nr:hypothetical protein KQX54_015617 [Cotesia glomerata]
MNDNKKESSELLEPVDERELDESRLEDEGVAGPSEISSDETITGDLFDEVVDDAPIEVVRLINAPNYMKKMSWVKLPFGPVTICGSTHGSGAIIDGNHRLRVQIANYMANPLLVKGVYVRILCQSSVDPINSYLMVRNSDDIVIEPGTSAMTEVGLHRSGFITPTKKSCDDQGGVPKKFAPFA